MKKILKRKSDNTLNKKIFIAGSGGQGILFLGKSLYLAAVLKGYNATYFPSYGAEVRGGAAKCIVIISNNKIASPVIKTPDTAIILNKLSFSKYSEFIKNCKNIFMLNNDSNEINNRKNSKKLILFSCKNGCIENIKAAGIFCAHSKLFNKNEYLKALKIMLSKKDASVFEKNKKIFLEAYENFKL